MCDSCRDNALSCARFHSLGLGMKAIDGSGLIKTLECVSVNITETPIALSFTGKTSWEPRIVLMTHRGLGAEHDEWTRILVLFPVRLHCICCAISLRHALSSRFLRRVFEGEIKKSTKKSSPFYLMPPVTWIMRWKMFLKISGQKCCSVIRSSEKTTLRGHSNLCHVESCL